jgi:hypothetical protein
MWMLLKIKQQGHGSLPCQLQPQNTIDDRQGLPDLLPEMRELRLRQIENKALIKELRKQNQKLKSILAEYNTALKKCIQMLEKPMENGY